MRGGYRRVRLSISAWHRAIVLAYLARTGVPATMNQMGLALGIDHTTLHRALFSLEGMGAIDRELLPDSGKGMRQSLYQAARILRMAAAS